MTQHPQDPARAGETGSGSREPLEPPVQQERPSSPEAPRSASTPAGADTRAPRAGNVPATPQRMKPTTAPTPDPALDQPKKRGVSGTVWAALILGVIILILLLVFVIQNNASVGFEYMAWSFNLPLGVAILLAAIAGALVMALVGSVRMFTLSRRVRRLEKERSRIKDALG